jgi:hypothetical protein
MATRLNIEELIEAARRLPPEDRARLIRALAEDSSEPQHEITELRGLGKEVWGNIDAQEYVNSERDSWEK